MVSAHLGLIGWSRCRGRKKRIFVPLDRSSVHREHNDNANNDQQQVRLKASLSERIAPPSRESQALRRRWIGMCPRLVLRGFNKQREKLSTLTKANSEGVRKNKLEHLRPALPIGTAEAVLRELRRLPLKSLTPLFRRGYIHEQNRLFLSKSSRRACLQDAQSWRTEAISLEYIYIYINIIFHVESIWKTNSLLASSTSCRHQQCHPSRSPACISPQRRNVRGRLRAQ